MKKILLFFILFLVSMTMSFGQARTWNGSVSSNWNIPANWTPAIVPNTPGQDAIITGAGIFQPILSGIITIGDLTMSNGTLGLAGFTLTISDDAFLTGGSINNGILNVNDFRTMQNMVFAGSIGLTKTGGTFNDLAGGNTFNGPTIITNTDNDRLRFANTNGDTFLGSLVVNKNGTGNIEMSYNGTNSINNITINNSNTGGQMNFGVGGGTSTLVTGGLITTGFVGTLVVNNMTQLLNVANGPFTLATFTSANSTFLGNLQVTTTGAINFNGNNNFRGNNTFIAGNGMNMPTGNNSFSNPGNTTTLTRNGGGAVTWAQGNTFTGLNLTDNSIGGALTMAGGNTFNGTTLITNNSNTNLQFANTIGDTFNGLVTFQNNNASFMDIARRGSTTFAQQVTINNTNGAGEVRFGEFGGTSVLQTGGLVTTAFAACNILEINNFTQLTNVPNGIFNTVTFTSQSNSFQGDFRVTTSGNMTFTNANTFQGNNTFIAGGQITMTAGGNTFSLPSNATTITRNGGGGITWGAGNTFGNLTLTNNGGQLVMNGGNIFNGNTLMINQSNNNIRLGEVVGDTFNGPVTFQNNGTAYLDISRRGTNIFQDQVTINNTAATGEIRIGEFGGTSELRNGGLVTTDFAVCNILEINNFTQLTNAPNGPIFNTITFTSANSTFLGNFTVNTTGTGIMSFTGSNRYDGTNIFNSNARIVMSGSNFFSTVVGNSTTFVKGAASNSNDDWFGGNSFGTVQITNNSPGGRLRLANTQGDTFLRTSTFIHNGTGSFEIARSGTNLFVNNVTINNTNAGGTMNFGINGGTSTLISGGLLTTNYSVGNNLTINNFSQVSDVTNGSFSMNTFAASGTVLRGDFSVTTALTGITISNGSSFLGNNTFIAATGIGMSGGNTFSTRTGSSTTMIKNGNTDNDWQGGNTFGNFTLVNNGAGRIRMANSVGGDTFIGNVTFDKNAIGSIDPAFNGTSRFAGNISTALSNTVLTFGLGTGTVEINGSTAQNLLTAGGTLIPILRRVRMNGTGTFVLSNPISIPISLELIGGIINNNENILTFLSGAVVTGGSNASHVNGRIRKVGNTAFTYPFGNGGFYAPLTTPALGGAATQHFTGRYFQTNPDLLYNRTLKDASIGEVNTRGYWEFTNTNSTAIPTLTLPWSSNITSPIIDFNEFVVTQWHLGQWRDLGRAGLFGIPTSGTVRNLTPVPTFAVGIFTLAQSFMILPIELLSFSAAVTEDERIKVSWSTSQEKNNAFFTLEKSLDGTNWSAIGLIPGAGDSEIVLFYDFIDESPVFGRQFYRLTQTDYDGTSETFKVVGVTLQSNKETIEYKVYPNPSTGIVKVLSQNTNMEEAEITVLDSQGQVIRSIKGITGRLVEIDLSSLPRGLYLMQIKNNHHFETKKVVIN